MKKLFIASLLLFSTTAFSFTESELASLQSAALAEPTIQSCITAGDDGCVANWFNAPSEFIVWKTSLIDTDVYADPGFDFTLVDGLTTGKRDEWTNFLFKNGFINPSKSNIRSGIADVWSGTAGKVAVQNAILALSKRPANNAEKALSTGTGTTVSPGVMTFEGTVRVDEIHTILGR